MKKILFAIAFVTMMAFGANAQNDNFVFDHEDDWNLRDDPFSGIALPSGIGMDSGSTTGNPSAPLGSGLLVLTALGAGYAVAQRRRK